MMKMDELAQAKSFLRRQFSEGARVLCAVSGGLDSMCLLDLLASWGTEKGILVSAAHFNHRLRGAEADRDEAFVRDICAARGIPFRSGSGDTWLLVEQEGLSVEEAARILRYRFLQHAAEELNCAAILTAHHADDNAETMLLNLLRGTGSAGLAGIPQRRGNVYRPFLRIARAELEVYAARHGVPHVEDATNADPDAAARNMLRHKVLPVLKELNPRVLEHMSRTSAILAAESEALESLAAELAGRATQSGSGVSLNCAVLSNAPAATAERAVLQLLARAAGHRQDLTAAHVSAVAELARGRRTDLTVSLPYGLTAWREGDMLHIKRRSALPEEVSIRVGQTVSFGDWTVFLEERPCGAWNAGRKELPYGIVCGPLRAAEPFSVTAWRSGDRMALAGQRGKRSLKRLCADRGVTPQQRDALPVLRMGAAPAAVPGLGADVELSPDIADSAVYAIFHHNTEENKHEK